MYKVPLMMPSLPDKSKFIEIIDELWESRMLSNFSKYSKLFEQGSKDYFNSHRYFMSVVSCDIGLTLILKCFDFPKGSEVLVPSFTFNSTVNGIMWNDLKPIFVDIDPNDYTISLEDMRKKVGPKTVAIMGVHIFGNPCRLDEIDGFAQENNLKVIYDSAHAYGSKYKGKHVCEFGDAGAFSFSGTKVITSAEGGLVYFKDKQFADKFNLMRQYGFINDYNTKFLGLNGKISEFHSALAYLSLPLADGSISRRQQVANKYKDGLKNCTFQQVAPGDLSTYKDFSILVENRDEIYEKLNKAGVQSKKYFFPNHYTDYYKEKFGEVSLPNTENVYNRILCLPIFNDITDEQIQYVIDSI
jgi:dTDP-4-amino-4,6-dideoxygalactose transaminase